ncbi:MAG: glycosyltransferase [bacterium]
MQKICIIIPCYNEENRLPVEEFKKFYTEITDSFYLYFVNDGSTDKTKIILDELCMSRGDRIKILNHDCNKGKAEAVRTGVLNALDDNKFDIFGYLDADLSTPLSEIYLLLESLNKDDCNAMAFGSRIKKLNSNIRRNTKRHIFGRLFATTTNLLLKLPTYDSQCGAKLIRAEYARGLFKEAFISKWLFDIELFFRFKRMNRGLNNNYKTIEVPLNTWDEKGGSKITMRDLTKMPLDLIKIYFYYK